MGQLAESAWILQGELKKVGFEGELREKLLLAWWKGIMAGIASPDFSEILRGLMPEGDE